MTFPRDLADLPTRTPGQYPGVFADGSTTRPPGDRTSIRQVNYTYEGLRLDRHGDGFTARFRVRNTGSRAGTETARLYVTLPGRGAAEPGKRLAGSERVTLRPGQARTVGVEVEVEVDADSADHPLSVWDSRADRRATVPGTYRVQVGRSSRDLPLSAAVRLS
ncbi:fibronectin type III-like domain-contianing protein [Nonomuraea gerenzanensis]|nr:fibronectin type III-like domain-contianing protein [Nonomuraea gerenzanensis]UBU17921.1 fibronectin type III-like domain-contianing protein [Nonomuraea gerenzanensis]